MINCAFPKLYDLYCFSSNIPSSSAFTESFFRIAGIINDKRRLRMKTDLVEKRAIMKANMEILDNLTKLNKY